MHVHYVHCETFDANSGISVKGAIRHVIDLMVLISELLYDLCVCMGR